MVLNKILLTQKRKNELLKVVQHAEIDADYDIEKTIKILFPELNKEERYKIYSLILLKVSPYLEDDEDEDEN